MITFDPPENVGGVEGRARNYTAILARNGILIGVISFSPSYKFTKTSAYGAPLLRLPSSAKSLPFSFRVVLDEINANRIDCIFFLSGGTSLIGNVLLCYARMKRIATAVFLYGKDILSARASIASISTLYFGLSLANRVIANSHFTASLLPRSYQWKIEILHPAIDPHSLQHGQKMLSRLEQENRRTVLFVGRLVKRKGVDVLLLAFKKCLTQFPNLKLEIVGDGPEFDNLKKMAKELGLVDEVIFRGQLTGEQLYTEYSQCEVFVMPSTTTDRDVEGFGTVFLEAGLFGKPCIGTFSGGIPEAILNHKTGLLVPENDDEALSSAIERILSDNELAKRLGENGKFRVLDEFTWEKTTNALYSILQQINQGHRSV